MIEVYALAAVALLAAGAVIGFVALVSLGIHREETARSVTTPTSDRVARGARAATGMYARLPGVLQEASHHRQDRLLDGQEIGGSAMSANSETRSRRLSALPSAPQTAVPDGGEVASC
jgi:hypothetical protein